MSRIINQDINTKDDDTSQNNTSEPLNVQTGQEGKVADTDVAENSSTATNPKDASDKADVIEPESDVVKDADNNIDKDVQHDVDHLSDMSDNNHFDKYDLKEMDTQIPKILIEMWIKMPIIALVCHRMSILIKTLIKIKTKSYS